jgi:hypothetical protein
MRSCKLSKKKWFAQCRAGALTRTLEKPQRDMLNKRELVKLDVEVARLKARLGQNDGLLGHCSLLILSLHGPMISKSEMRKPHRVSVMICYSMFLISF